MKRIIFLGVLIVALIICGVSFFLKFKPPLEIGTLALSTDNKSVVVEVGNKGFYEVKIVEVLVNNHENPAKIRLQISNALQGFIIMDDYNSIEAKKYGFTNIDEVAIKTGTSPSLSYEKLDDSTASNKDEIYGVSVIHNEEIYKVQIKYNYLGISFNDTVILN